MQCHRIAGERARFVEHHRIDLRQGFQPLQVAHQHALARQRACCRQHRHRCGQRQGAGTSDDEHRHRHHQRVPRVFRPPPSGSSKGSQQHSHQKRFGDAVRQLGQAWLLQASALHQGHDLCKAGLGAHTFHANFYRRLQVVAASSHRAAFGLVHRGRFTGQQGFVGLGAAFENRAVGRKRLARQDAHRVAHHQAPHRHAGECTISAQALHAVGQAIEHRLQRTGRAVTQAQLQPAPGEQEENEHGQRVEVHLATKDAIGVEGACRAHHKGDAHAKRHGQIHAHLPLAYIAQGTGKERAAGKKDHGQRNHPRGPAQQRFHLLRQIAGLRHVRRPCVHHHLHHAKTGHQPAPQRTAAFHQPLAAHKSIHGRNRAIPRAAHRCHPLRWQHPARLPHHAGATGGGAHIGLQHTGHGLQGIFNGEGTGRAMHSIQHHMRIPG